MNRINLRIILCTAGTLVVASASAQLFTFDTPADLPQLATSVPVSSVSTGVNGSGGLRATDANPYALAAYTGRSFRLSQAGDFLTLSLMFRFDPPPLVSNGGGITDSIASLRMFADPTPADPFVNQLVMDYTLTQFTPSSPILSRARVESLQGGGGNGQFFDVDPLGAGRWYKLSGTFSILGDATNTNQFKFSLDDFGTTGLTKQFNVFQTTFSSTFFPKFHDTTAWAGFGMSRYSFGHGADVVDNFQIAPEPATLGMLLAPLGLAVIWRRRF